MSNNLNKKMHELLNPQAIVSVVPNYSGNAAIWGRLMHKHGIGINPAFYGTDGKVSSWMATDQYGGNEVTDDTPGRALCFCLIKIEEAK